MENANKTITTNSIHVVLGLMKILKNLEVIPALLPSPSIWNKKNFFNPKIIL